MIVWLTGNSGAGKSTLAKYINNKLLTWINLDGDEMRQSISTDLGLSPEDREEHNLRVARLAGILHEQGFNVIISVIAPFQSTRDKIDKNIKCIWVYLKRNLPIRQNFPYEEPNCYTLNVDELSIEEEYNLLIEYLVKDKNDNR